MTSTLCVRVTQLCLSIQPAACHNRDVSRVTPDGGSVCNFENSVIDSKIFRGPSRSKWRREVQEKGCVLIGFRGSISV
jgi:hypothetical protein